MNNSSDHFSSSEDTACDESQSRDDEPKFGVVDIVEAFTAMRHEWRGQTKESRQLAEKIETAASTLQNLEAKMLACLEDNSATKNDRPVADESIKLAQLVAETDHQFTRALQAIKQTENHRHLREQDEAHALESYFSSRPAITRWFARPLLEFVNTQRQPDQPSSGNPALEGLNLVLARLRRSMQDLDIERVDTQGQPFDAQTMNAIGTMESSTHAPGHVAEQLSPCYRWKGQVLRFADVRVAREQPDS